MKEYRPVKLFITFLVCFAAIVSLMSLANAGVMRGKLARCRKNVKGNIHRALNCFSEVMVDGDPEERRIASYFLELLVDTPPPDRIPSLADASKYVRKAEPVVEETGGAVPTAVIYHGRKSRSVKKSKKNQNTAAQAGKRAHISANSNTKSIRGQASRKSKPVKFQIEDLTPSPPVRVNSAKVTRKPGAAPQIGGFDIREKPSALKKMVEKTKQAGLMDISSVTLQLVNLTPNLKVGKSADKKSKKNPRPVASDSLSQAEHSKVVLARLNTSTAVFIIEDDLAPEQESSTEPVREVFFGTNAVEIGKAQIFSLEQAAKLLGNRPGKIIVRGLASPNELNPANLSKMRAKIVAHLLKQKFHVPSGKIKVEWGVGANQEDQRALMIVRAPQ
ncbi:MAG TPA: hypothetical protein DCL44_05150 [Elusimicrobia bacterium]|nr:hypothetical protein [Elusimicrobiota bacterium]